MNEEQQRRRQEHLQQAQHALARHRSSAEWVFLDTHERVFIADDMAAQLVARIEHLERLLGVSDDEPEDLVRREFERAWDATLDEMARDMWPVTVVNTRAIFKKHGGSIARNTLEKRVQRYRGMLRNEKLLSFIRREIKPYQNKHSLFDGLKHLPPALVAGLVAEMCLACSHIDQFVQHAMNVF